MRQWVDFLDFVMPDVPGCLPNVATLALRQAAKEFFERSRCWRERLEPVSTVAGQADYAYELLCGQAVVKLESATLDGRPLQVLTAQQSEVAAAAGAGGSVYAIAHLNHDEFELFPTPTTDDGAVVVFASLRPGADASGIADELFNEWAEPIAAGAKARLMVSPKKPYTDLQTAMLHRQILEGAIADAGVRAFKQYGRNKPRVPGFFF